MTLTLDTEAILLDPSMFLGPEGFGWLQEIPLDERKRFVAPLTYYRQLAREVEYTKVDEELWGAYPDEDTRGQLAELLWTLTLFGEGDASDDLPPEVSTVTSALREAGSQVALEEWLYLNSHSWLAARTRRIIDHFKRAGSRAVEMAGDALDALTWRVLQLPGPRPDTLTPELRKAAGIRVLTTAGPAVAGAIAPWLGVLAIVVVLVLPTGAPPAVP